MYWNIFLQKNEKKYPSWFIVLSVVPLSVSLVFWLRILLDNFHSGLLLDPTQIKLLPVTDAVMDFCYEVSEKVERMGLRVEVDRETERLAKQIHNTEKALV